MVFLNIHLLHLATFPFTKHPNIIKISSNDLIGDFNAHWTSKLIAASEETILEKKEAYEKIKDLSTAKEITRNEKNKSITAIPNMLHFIFCSNYEDSFIRIDKYDSRLWIRKVNTIENKIMDFDQKIEDEVPYFVDFLMKRDIKYKYDGDRLFFNPKAYRTAAFENVVNNSEPNFIKDLRERFEEYFDKYDVDELNVCAKDLIQYFGVSKRYGTHYINKSV